MCAMKICRTVCDASLDVLSKSRRQKRAKEADASVSGDSHWIMPKGPSMSKCLYSATCVSVTDVRWDIAGARDVIGAFGVT